MIDWDAVVLAPGMAVFGEKPEQQPVYTSPDGGVSFGFDGVFDDAYEGLGMGSDGEPVIATVQPVIGVRLVQFAAAQPVQNGTVYLPRLGRTFVVVNVQPDGHGWAKLLLNLQG